MTEEQKAKIRQTAVENGQRVEAGLAPLYLGRTCPLKRGASDVERECDGPKCMLYAPLNDDPQKPNAITGGACSIPLGVHHVARLNETLTVVSRVLDNAALNQNRILDPSTQK